MRLHTVPVIKFEKNVHKKSYQSIFDFSLESTHITEN